MASPGTPDISFVDIDELGFRPRDWTDESSCLESDDTARGYSGEEKSVDYDHYASESYPMATGKQFGGNETHSILSDDELHDDSDYEIDPETGEKIFRETAIVSSLCLSSSNYNWIEQYLSNLPDSSSANQLLPVARLTTSEFIFDNLSPPDHDIDWKHSNWFSKYLPVDRPLMFADTSMDDKTTLNPLIYSPLHFNNLFSDEHSTSNTSSTEEGPRRQRRYQSSLESDSTTPDCDITFDGHFLEAKLEKIEHCGSNIPHMFVRRTSTRTISQGQQDEDTLRRYNIPLIVADITQSTTEEYNRHLARLNHLTSEQMHIIKDIRRRGKNKIAAQNCRKRKASGVETLSDEVDDLKRVKQELEEQKRAYQQQIDQTRHQYEYLHRQVLPNRQLPPAIFVK